MGSSYGIKVSVIIPTYNRCKSLEQALQSITKLDFPREQFEVVIVDNNSNDDTPGVVDKLSYRVPAQFLDQLSTIKPLFALPSKIHQVK